MAAFAAGHERWLPMSAGLRFQAGMAGGAVGPPSWAGPPRPRQRLSFRGYFERTGEECGNAILFHTEGIKCAIWIRREDAWPDLRGQRAK